MKRVLLPIVVALVTAAVMVSLGPAVRADGSITLQTSALGKSLADFQLLYAAWAHGVRPGHHGNYQFLPLPAGNCSQRSDGLWECVGALDASLESNEGFLLMVNGYTGWRYCDGSVDAPLPDAAFTGVDLSITLDGATLLSTANHDSLATFYVGPQYFPRPYPAPANQTCADPGGYGSDIFFQGVSVLVPPLAEGTHTLHLSETATAFGMVWDNTWTLKVAK
jgi:hypothetical protein